MTSTLNAASPFDQVAAIRWTQFAIASLLSLAGVFSAAWPLETRIAIDTLCWGIVVSYLWSMWSWRHIRGSLFDWYAIFLTAATLFNGGQAFLEVFRLNQHGILGGLFSDETLVKTLYLSLIALAWMHFGALLAVKTPAAAQRRGELLPVSDEELTSLRLVGGALLLAALPFSVVLLQAAVEVVMANGYGALYTSPLGTGLPHGAAKVLATFLVPALFFVLAASRNSRAGRWFAMSVLLGYSVVNVFLGVRHEAAIQLLAVAWLWNRHIRPVSFTLVFTVAAAALFVVFPLVAATRRDSGENRLSLNYLTEQYFTLENPAIAALSEMGGSMMTISHTMELVPDPHEYELGASYGFAVLTLFPNLFWDIHPTIARKIPSEWLTWEIDPYIAELGMGFGYSFIAEAYLNFGWYGLPVVMALTGYLISRAVRWAEQAPQALRAATIASAACFVLFYVRAELAVIVRGVVWYACVPYVAALTLTRAQHAFARRSAARRIAAAAPLIPTVEGQLA